MIHRSDFMQVLNPIRARYSKPIMVKWCRHQPDERCRCDRKPYTNPDRPAQKRANTKRYYIEGPDRTRSEELSYFGATTWRWRKIYADLQNVYSRIDLVECYMHGHFELASSENVFRAGHSTHKNLMVAHKNAVNAAIFRHSVEAKAAWRAKMFPPPTPPATPQDAQTIADRHGMTLDAAVFIITGF